ncbi:EAL domain-containing protein [Geitlerinema sp. PCC 9228]|uniref:two-component system response regulator n=1 Tax=Geitlerinema sp. PCC 9228 TaxID=111611 RepID=UPI0008F9D177|nr:EAL domain-containing protein [Geitlerinema sp. PCC 9228]
MSEQPTNPASILVVDDEVNGFDVIETLLFDQGYQLYYAPSGEKALEFLQTCQPDVILLDVMMPEMDGMEVCRRVKAGYDGQYIPIIMVTALTAKENLAQCLQAGADDFVGKPINGLELRARVASMLRIRQQHKNIEQLCLQLQSNNQNLEAEVAERTKQLQQRIHYDPLTGFPSRTSLLETLERELSHCQKYNQSLALLYIDCDEFNLINSSLGYEIGDRILVAISERLSSYLKSEDRLFRTGEDEFCILLKSIKDTKELSETAADILQLFEESFVVESYETFISVSIGISLTNAEYQNPQDMVRDADTAMYKAKTKGPGTYRIFDQELKNAIGKRLSLENDLRRALERKEFIVYYQPIINLKTEQICGFEALIRWQHPQRGMVSPGEFIPCLEDTGFIVPVGLEVMQQACQQLKTWQEQGATDLEMSVNLSVRQFSHPTLLEDLHRIIQTNNIHPSDLKLEITESAIVDNPDATVTSIQKMRQAQIKLAIDDFGTGYSSLSYLQKFPVDNLKVDRSFVKSISENHRNYYILQEIVKLGQALGMTVTAEGIETETQMRQLQNLGCEYAQGYFFAKPMSGEEATQLLREKIAV